MQALAYKQVGTQALQFSVQQVSYSVTLFYWNPVTGAWQSTVPTFSIGQQGGVRVRVTNNLGFSWYYRVDMSTRRPDGSSLGIVTGTVRSLAAGGQSDWDFMFTADQVGTWQHNLGLYSGDSPTTLTMLLSQGWTNAAIVQAVAAGTVTGYEFQNPQTGAWQTSAPTLYVGQTLYLKGYGRNDSGASMRARMDAEVTKPSGSVSTITGAVATQAAGELGWWTFTISLDEVGTWSVELVLYGELA